jgi:beta-galactosidase/beta-glucuronidase
VPGIRVPGGQQSPAFVKASIEVKNTSKEIVRGKLVVEFDGKTYDSDVTLNPLEIRLISIPEITVNNPQLWWPNGMGKQPLYPVTFTFVSNGRTNDSEIAKIGIRETGNYFDTNIKAQVFTVNGQKVFIKVKTGLLQMLCFDVERTI